jgi:hypothetical protein
MKILQKIITMRRVLVVLLVAISAPQQIAAHGGVVADGDLCIIEINYLQAHFKIYQPLTDGHEEYCEDLPNATDSVFVMEYMHKELATVPIEFRIIHDVTGKGRFAIWQDILEIDDLDGVTVFYQAPVIEPDVFTVIYNFEEEGDYIGIVTVKPESGDREYIAVFPFEVGYTGLGYWPLIIIAVLLIQFQYLLMSGRISRWRR